MHSCRIASRSKHPNAVNALRTAPPCKGKCAALTPEACSGAPSQAPSQAQTDGLKFQAHTDGLESQAQTDGFESEAQKLESQAETVKPACSSRACCSQRDNCGNKAIVTTTQATESAGAPAASQSAPDGGSSSKQPVQLPFFPCVSGMLPCGRWADEVQRGECDDANCAFLVMPDMYEDSNGANRPGVMPSYKW